MNTRATRVLCLLISMTFAFAACGDDSSDSDDGGTSTNNSTTSTNSGTTSTNSGTTSTNSGTTSTNSGTTGTNNGTTITSVEEAFLETPSEGCTVEIVPSPFDQDALQLAFIEAEAGDTVCMSAGTYSFVQQVTLGSDNVTVRGAGADTTILDFSAQDVGANGLAITGNGVTLEAFQVLNTPGDGIRATDVDDITFRDVNVIWEAESSEESGAYGLYPVGCDGVLIEGCVVQGARDAGVYVGQSTNIIVRNNEARGNVAGIEIENSTDADVYDNYAHDNTAGILIFNLPDLDVYGSRAKVHNNRIEANNRANFAPEGNIVGNVPAGTGLFILACDDNEVHDNTISDNDSVAVAVVSYHPILTGSTADDPDFDIYPQGNWVHDNAMSNNGNNPDVLLRAIVPSGRFPDLAWDGCEDENLDNSDGAYTNCFSNNTNDDGAATYLDFRLCGGDNSTDIGPVTCERTPLPRVAE